MGSLRSLILSRSTSRILFGALTIGMGLLWIWVGVVKGIPAFAIYYLGAVLFLVFGFWIITGNYFTQRRLMPGWSEFASRAGLRITPAKDLDSLPRITGMFNGRRVGLRAYKSKNKKSDQNRMSMRIGIKNPNDYKLILEPTLPSLGVLTAAMGVQDIEIGDAELDSRFIIKSQPTAFGQRVFEESQVKEALRSLNNPRGYEFEFDRKGLIVDSSYLEADSEYLYNLLETMSALADAIESALGDGSIAGDEAPLEDDDGWENDPRVGTGPEAIRKARMHALVFSVVVRFYFA